MLLTDQKINEALLCEKKIRRKCHNTKDHWFVSIDGGGRICFPFGSGWHIADLFADDWEIIEDNKDLKFPDDYKKIWSGMNLYRLAHDSEGNQYLEKYGTDCLIRNRDWDNTRAIRLDSDGVFRQISPENTRFFEGAYSPGKEILDDDWELWIPK